MSLPRYYSFVAVLEPCEDGSFSAYFPDLPGTATGGDSETETVESAKECAAAYLFTLFEQGKTLPKPTQNIDVNCLEEGSLTRQIDVDMAAFYPDLFKERRGGSRPGSGRPKLAPGAPRSGRQASRSLMIRLTDEEFNALAKKAKASKKTKAEFVRDLLFND